jgi:hypothetical protein
VDRCQCRAARAQRNPIGLALRALVRLEWHRFSTGVSWFEAKFRIVREAIRRYLEQPLYQLPQLRPPLFGKRPACSRGEQKRVFF